MRTLALAMLLAIGCTGSSNYWIAYKPVAGDSTQPKATIVQRAIVALTDAGRDVETSDVTTGIVLSKWFAPDGMFSDEQRHRIRVTIDDAGHYEVVALCNRKKINGSGWEECGNPDTRPRFVVETVEKISASLR